MTTGVDITSSRPAASEPRDVRSRVSPASVFMTILIYPLLILQTLIFILLAPLVLPMARLVSGQPIDRLVRYFIWVYGRVWMILISPFVRFEKFGMSQGRFPHPCIIVLNHLSFFDIFCMGALPFSNVVFTVRSWPFRMPWYAPFMRLAKYVDMESLGADNALNRCRNLSQDGAYLVFFPEGHRSRDGSLGRFYSGAFKLAVEAGIPIVPVCITGTDRLLPPGNFLMAPATIRLQALPAVDPSNFPGDTGHVALRKQVKAAMAEAIALHGGNAKPRSLERG